MLILHTLPTSILHGTYAVLHIWQAVPIFLILTGFNTGRSLLRKYQEEGFHRFYTKTYFLRHAQRMFIPFVVLFCLSLVLGLLRNAFTDINTIYIGPLSLLGFLPTTGPGNYYITLLFQFVLIAPLIVRLYISSPRLMLLVCFAVDLCFQLIAPYVLVFNEHPYLYSASIFRYLSAIALGVLLVDYYARPTRHRPLLAIGAVMSFIYLLLAALTGDYAFPLFLPHWGTQNILSFFYPLVLVMLLLKILPHSGFVPGILGEIGKGSYHIFLFQIVYFPFSRNILQKMDIQVSLPVSLIINLFLCLVVGMAFYYLNNQTNKIISRRFKLGS